MVFFSCSKTDDKPAYKDATLTPEERAKDLISRMTLEEKVAQMHCIWIQKRRLLLDSTGNFDIAKARKNFPNGLGQVGRPSDSNGGLDAYANAKLTNDIQKYTCILS
jgi:beta-glucosidase